MSSAGAVDDRSPLCELARRHSVTVVSGELQSDSSGADDNREVDVVPMQPRLGVARFLLLDSET